jgi:hypothetical protein
MYRGRDKVHGVDVGGVGKTMSKFVFTSHLIAVVKYRPYWERGGKWGRTSGAVNLEERSVQMVRKDVCK